MISIRICLAIFGQKRRKYVEELNKRFDEYAAMSLGFDNNCPKPAHKKIAGELRRFYLGNKSKKIDNTTKLAMTDVSVYW